VFNTKLKKLDRKGQKGKKGEKKGQLLPGGAIDLEGFGGNKPKGPACKKGGKLSKEEVGKTTLLSRGP